MKNAKPKKCSCCKEVKPLSQFERDKGRTDGLGPRCKACINARERQKRRNSPEEVRERTRLKVARWRANNPEKNRQIAVDFYLRHPKKKAEYDSKRRGARGGFTTQEWLDLCESTGNKCLRCGIAEVKLSVDHVVPISKGGSTDISNLQPLCRSCNSKKSDKTMDYR